MNLMNKYIVTPLVGFDSVKFGMSRDEIRGILGIPTREFKKSKYSKSTTDDYGAYHIFYDINDRFEAVEFFEETMIFDNKGNAFPRTAEALSKLPYHFVSDDESHICTEQSIGVYAPDGNVESILFACEGYY